MGTRIEAAATAHGRRRFGRSTLHLTDDAARTCLRRGGHRAGELDVLVDTSVYKDLNVAEPALAAIVQHDIEANPHMPPDHREHGTFSFDLQNGGCGVVTAAQMLNGLVGAGRAELAMIVAADADPSPSTSRGFPFEPVAGALLLAHGDADSGFTAFATRTFPQHAALFEAALRWSPGEGFLHRGRNVLEVKAAPELASACVGHAGEVVDELLAKEHVVPGEIDLVIASPYPHGFASRLPFELHIPADRVPLVEPPLARAHTAGPIAALEAAIASGQFAAARRVLFVTAGAGITIAAALYTGSS